MAERYRQRLEGEVPTVVYPFRTIHKDGSVRWAEINSVLIPWEEKPAVMSYLSDITERMRVEEELRASESRYRLLVENANEAILVVQDGMLKFVNRMACELTGYSEQELRSRPFPEFIHPEDRDMVVERYQRRIKGDVSMPRYAFRLVTREDSIKWVEIAAVLIDWEGKPATLNFLTDITERKQAEQALRESEERYRTMMEQAADAVFMHDEMGRILDVNRQACNSLGYSREELLSKSIVDIDPEAIPIEKRELWGKVLAGEQATFESRQIRKDGIVIPVEVTLGSVRLPLGPAVLGIVRDITERKQLEERIGQVRSDLLYAVSHELKTPLFLMTAMMELIKSQPEEERQRQFLIQEETWTRNLARLRLLINNLVDSQRTATLGTQIYRVPTDLGIMVNQAIKDLETFAVKQRITWQLDLEPLPDVPLDVEAIERVLHNLLTNAIKFSPTSGTVQIRLHAQPDQAVLEVEDHGQGIPEVEISRLFQPFARAGGTVKAVIPGTGLGLYVSKMLVEAHGGTIALTSEEGKGTTVTVTLPLRE